MGSERKPVSHLSLVAQYVRGRRNLLETAGLEGDDLEGENIRKNEEKQQKGKDLLSTIEDKALSNGYDFNKIVRQGEVRLRSIYATRKT